MAWFRRNRGEAPEAAGEGTGAVASEPTVAPGPEPVDVVEPAATGPAAAPTPTAPAWTTAAPMPSAVPMIQRVLDRVDARGSTTLGQPAPLSLAPLGHAVTPDAPAGLVSTVAATTTTTTTAPDAGAPLAGGQPPLEYVQRAPAGSPAPRPAPPTQLLVPAFQPGRLPTVPVAPPEVQRAALAPSLTTAPPPPGPPLVLPVGEVIASPGDGGAFAAPGPSAQAPLLSAPPSAPEASPPGVDATPAAPAELPLAPVQRHADHPGHVDGDEAPTEEVQRAVAESPAATAEAQPAAIGSSAPLAPADAPVLGDSTPLGATPTAAAEVGAPAIPPGDVQRAADVPLPLAPVQRHADHPGHVEGDEAPAEAEVQRAVAGAPVSASPPGVPAQPPGPDLTLPGPPVQRRAAPGRPVGLGHPLTGSPPAAFPPGSVPHVPPAAVATPPSAPLLGAPPPPAPSLPPAAVQRAATAAATDDEGGADDGPAGDAPSGAGEAPALDLVQRASVEAPAPPAQNAPLVGQAPLERTLSDIGPTPSAPAPAIPAHELPLVQRATLAGAGPTATSAAAPSSTTSAATPVFSTAPLPPLVVAPLLGGRPFSTQVQRSSDGAASAPAGLVDRSSPEALSPEPGRTYQPLAGIGMWNGAPPPDLPGPAIEAPPGHVAAAVQRATGTDVSNVRIRRDTGPTVQRLSARAFTHEGEVHIPASVGSLSSGEGASLATHELVHAGQQSALGSSRPHEHTPGGQALEAQARSAEHASLAGLELPTLPLAPPSAPAVQRAPAEGGGSSPFSPQQLSTLLNLASSPPSNGATVQRLADPPAPPPPPPAAEAVPDAAAAPAAHQQTPQELEELATKLFPTLRNLFRSELLGFRRRSGTSSDRPLS